MTQNAGTWGASRIHGELKMLGYDISERSVLRGMREVPRSPVPAKGWMAFLSNQCEAIAAMNFFIALGGASLCPEHRDSPRVNSGGEPSAQKYYERQSSEPLPLLAWWAYRAVVLRVGPIELNSIRNELALLIKQYVLRRDRSIEKMRREVETLENYERLEARPVSQFL